MARRAGRVLSLVRGHLRPPAAAAAAEGKAVSDEAASDDEYAGVRYPLGYPEGRAAFDGTPAVWSGRVGFDALPPSRAGLRFTPLPGCAFGVEVHGLDLRDAAGPALPEVADALHRWGYLLIRRQGLSPAEQVAVGERLAPLVGAKLPLTSSADNGFTAANLVPGCPQIAALGTKQPGFDPQNSLGLPVNNSVKGVQWPERGACSWHADGPAFRTVGSFTFINMIKAPAAGQGGSTLYTNGHLLFDALPPRLRERAEAARVRYVRAPTPDLPPLPTHPHHTRP